MSWRDLFGARRRAADRDVARELRDHLELEAEEQARDGLTPAGARRAARLLFGNQAVVAEDVRFVGRWAWWAQLDQDVRYALRTFRRSPVFTATAIGSLALALGANASVFTVIHAALLRPLPVTRPDDLVLIATADGFSYPAYREMADRTHSLTHVFGASSTNRLSVERGGERERAGIKVVTGNYFEGLGVAPAAGRLFHAGDENERVAVISHGLWRTRHHASPDVIGSAIRISGGPFTIIGVAPAGFFGESPGESPDVWTTVALQPASLRQERGYTWLRLIGRLRPGVTLSQAEAELRPLAGEAPIVVSSGRRGTTGLRTQFAAPLTIVFALVGVVLLIACLNLASLLLTRGNARGGEIAVRLALGAGRARIVRQLMTENVLIAAVAGALGLWLSLWGTQALVGLVTASGQMLALDLRPDARVLLFAGGVTFAAALLFGLLPAMRTARGRSATTLTGRSRSVVGPDRRWTAREAFLVAQVALSLVLLACGAMLVRTVVNLRGQHLGLRTENLVVASLDGDRGYRPDRAGLLPALIERARALPGVERASAAAFGTLANEGGVFGLEVDGFTPRDSQDGRARADYIAPGYFATAGIPLAAGREFAWTDTPSSARVAIVNETMARFYFGEGAALGWRFRFNKQEYEVVGIARDAKYNDLRDAVSPRYVYFAVLQMGPGVRSLEMRMAGAGVPSLATVRALVRAIDPQLGVSEIQTMRERIDRKIARERMMATLAVFFGALTLLVASTGLYGTLAYATGLRTREIGLRLALGSGRAAVIWLVTRHALVQVAVGIVLGLAGALALGGSLASWLFGLAPGDAPALAFAAGLLLATAVCAVAVPGIRASRVHPAMVLRD